MNKYRYLLVDLDGTLVHFNTDEFIKLYLEKIIRHFDNYPFAKRVPEWILEGIQQMLNNDGIKTNRRRFAEYFSSVS